MPRLLEQIERLNDHLEALLEELRNEQRSQGAPAPTSPAEDDRGNS